MSRSNRGPEAYSALEPMSAPEVRLDQSAVIEDSAPSVVHEMAVTGSRRDEMSPSVATVGREEARETEKADKMLSALEKRGEAGQDEGRAASSSSSVTAGSAGASAARKEDGLAAWRNRIKSVQSSRVTPEVLQRIQEKSAQQSRAKKSLKDCKYLQRANFISSASNTITLQQQASPALFSSFSAPSGGAERGGRGVGDRGGGGSARAHAARSSSLQQSMNKRATKSSESRSNPASAPLSRAAKSVFAGCTVLDEVASSDEDSEDERLKELEDQLLNENAAMTAVMSSMPAPPPSAAANNVFGFPAGAVAGNPSARAAGPPAANPFAVPIQAADLLGAGSLNAVDALLVQLIKEPTEENELAEKFSLFENMLSTVTTIREQTMTFWAENSDQFVGQAATECKKRIKAIDNTDSMGIQDDPSKWFVYHMTRQANLNAKNIANVLDLLRRNFELLAQDLGECPCCLEQLVEGPTTTTLGCCHKLCTDCWDHWLEMRGGGGVFCPLCRHGAFVEELFAENGGDGDGDGDGDFFA